MSTIAVLLLLMICLCEMEKARGEDDPCSDYLKLDSHDRAIEFTKLTEKSDRNEKWKETWYRFMGDAGDKIASVDANEEECFTSPSCGAKFPGYLEDTHPDLLPGKSEKGFVCFSEGQRCCAKSMQIEIRRCLGFYIYKLRLPCTAGARYCGDGVSPCKSGPCKNGGSCTVTGPDSFSCTCTEEFEGPTCEKKLPCSPGKKTNIKGRCCLFPFTYKGVSYDSCTTVDHGNKLWCSFDAVYKGQWAYCECPPGKKTDKVGRCCVFPFTYRGVSYDSCTTVDYGNRLWCSFDAVYKGQWANCVNPCTNNPCKNGGSCTVTGEDSYSCHCVKGFYGDSCEKVSPCKSGPCKNGGSCTVTGPDSFSCTCTEEFEGPTCEKKLPCPPGKKTNIKGRCCVFPFTYRGVSYDSCTTVDYGNRLWCSFDAVYKGRWANCVDECAHSPCKNGASCKTTQDGYSCQPCPGGWQGKDCDQAVTNNYAAKSCKEIKVKNNRASSGVYWIKPDGVNPAQVYCDQVTDGGGWTLVYSYTFTNYKYFAYGTNAITPRPNWPISSRYGNVIISTTPPVSETDYNAMDFNQWKNLGHEFMVKSNINHWIACREGSGSLVKFNRGSIQCRVIKNIGSKCHNYVPDQIKFHSAGNPAGSGLGPDLYRSQSSSHLKEYYYLEASTITRNWPTHDPCGTNGQNQVKNVANPHGNIYIRE